MKISNKLLSQLGIIYIVLPFLIFIGGWTKLYIAIPSILIVLICTYKVCKDMPGLWIPELNRDNLIKIFFIIGVLAIWVYYSGIGGFVFQNIDHTARNSIFNMLVQYKWPVKSSELLTNYEGETGYFGLIYYIGFWLPAAIIGKLFGLLIGYYFQAVWALLGLVLVYYFMCSRWKQIKVWPVFVLIFFSGLDIIGAYLTNMDYTNISDIWHIEWWSSSFQYSSMTTQLFWVFNQAIPIWLITILSYIQKNNKNLIFILVCSMLTSTLPFIGLLPITIFLCLTRKGMLANNKESEFKNRLLCLIKDTCTIQNVVGGGVIGILSFCYLSGNISGTHIMGDNTLGASLAKYVLFIILELGVYVVLLYKYQKENKFYYFIVTLLLVIPWLRVGSAGDFCMRASIPGLFLIMIWVIDSIMIAWKEKSYILFGGLVMTLLIGSVTPIFEMRRTFTETFRRQNAGEVVEAAADSEEDIYKSPNFSGNTETCFFYKYLAK